MTSICLGAGREAGDRLCHFVIEENRIVAVLIWCAAAWHIQDRDAMIGWDPITRSQRLRLVVQLRRFLVPEKTRHLNLASQCLGLAPRKLPESWHAEHGHRPLVAESFSDPESHHGTIYKATNWTYAGNTKGFSQDHTDYYLPNDKPKKLWLKPQRHRPEPLASSPHRHPSSQSRHRRQKHWRWQMRHDRHPLPPRRRTPRGHAPCHREKEDCEVSEARALLNSPEVDLENALVTADPLHNKEPTLRIIVEKGGDYLVGTKDNTSLRVKAVEVV